MPRSTKAHVARMRRLIRDLDSSGQSVREFSREAGLPESTLWYWRRRLRESAGEDDQARPATFLPVTVVPEPERGTGICVELNRGRQVHVSGGFDSDLLRRVIEVVESC